MQIPAKSKSQFWMVVASAGTMSHFSDYATLLANHDARAVLTRAESDC
jgi:hypothetical protein